MNARGRDPALMIASTARLQANQAAEMLCRMAVDDCRRKGYCSLAFSGGTTPRALFAVLAVPPLAATFPWHHTHFFWVDERMLAYSHTQSNYGTARRMLFDRVDVPEKNLNPMPVDGNAKQAAAHYEKTLQTFFQMHGQNDPVFDAVLLGLGADGHTASLFPGHAHKSATHRWVCAVRGGDPAVMRLTLTETVLNHARRVLFLVSGRAKATVVKHVLESGGADLPAGRIRPQSGDLTWLLDREAAALLSDKPSCRDRWHSPGTDGR